jgi:hypothetical protein
MVRGKLSNIINFAIERLKDKDSKITIFFTEIQIFYWLTPKDMINFKPLTSYK